MISLHLGDCLDVMHGFEPARFDLTVTSPPYDNLRTYKGYTFDFEGIARELYRVTKPGGVVVWVVGDATINGSETTTSAEQKIYFRKLGFNIHDTMIYRKLNYMPMNHNRYEQEFEYMFVFSKGKPNTFNPIKKKNKTAGKEYRTERPHDYDGHAMRNNRSERITTAEYAIKGNVFDYIIGGGQEQTNHPAPFPEALARDHILSWSNPGDTVFDPMVGSGTTGKMAVKYGRDFVGCEIAAEYYAIAERRIHDAQMQPTLLK